MATLSEDERFHALSRSEICKRNQFFRGTLDIEKKRTQLKLARHTQLAAFNYLKDNQWIQ